LSIAIVTKQPLSLCIAVVVLVSALWPRGAGAYSVLAHQSNVDAVWDSHIRPLLLAKYPGTRPDALREARAHAYGGSVIQDLGYFPFGSKFFTNLLHYVKTGDFVGEFLASLRFRAIDGAAETLDALGSAGLRIACVANWDVSLPDALAAAGLEGRFHTVVSSAEAGAPKPDPAPFRLALGRLAVPADHALHIGDSAADRDGARAAGLAFAPVPLATLPARLGIER